MSNPYNSATDRASILGPTLYFKGDLSAEEDLLIQGRVEGSITHTQRLTVGPQGTVKADIKAQLIIVEGTVDGDQIKGTRTPEGRDGTPFTGKRAN